MKVGIEKQKRKKNYKDIDKATKEWCIRKVNHGDKRKKKVAEERDNKNFTEWNGKFLKLHKNEKWSSCNSNWNRIEIILSDRKQNLFKCSTGQTVFTSEIR